MILSWCSGLSAYQSSEKAGCALPVVPRDVQGAGQWQPYSLMQPFQHLKSLQALPFCDIGE